MANHFFEGSSSVKYKTWLIPALVVFVGGSVTFGVFGLRAAGFLGPSPLVPAVFGIYFFLISLPLASIVFIGYRYERRSLLQKIYIDTMTGLPNRTRLFADVEEKDNPVLFLVNIDAFKEYNDFYGYEIGDQILLEINNRLQNYIAGAKGILFDNAALYKLQIDEYSILIDEKMSLDAVCEVAHDLGTIVTEDTLRYMGQDVPISVTVGIAEGRPEKILSAAQVRAYNIVARADMALKKAKIMKKNYMVYDESMQISREFEENISWTKKIRRAIKSDTIVPFYQPIVSNATGKVEKYECLIRMRDEAGHVIYPAAFLNTAKRSRLYPLLTRIMVEKVFENFMERDLDFSINISVDDILSPDTTAYIYDILTIHRRIAHRAIFEIVESEGIENYEEVLLFIREVKKYGCRIAIDDFGTGYSNFDYIMKLNVDFLKIDASIIKNIAEDKNTRIITETIVQFCRKMGIFTVAEFVHTRDVYELVQSLGIDYSQGFFLGEPSEKI